MNKDNDVAIIGMGYVGLTLATVMARFGFQVTGLEKRSEVVKMINRGKSHFFELGLDEMLSKAVNDGTLIACKSLDPHKTHDIYIITVGTPLDLEGIARVDMIKNAATQVAEHMPDGALVILRSTVKLGTTRDIVQSILSSTGKKFDLSMSPERTLEGDALRELCELPQIVGADDKSALDRSIQIFGRISGNTIPVKSFEAAELIKLVDNTFRDVSFGFANEVARICEAYGINAFETINAANLGYKRTNIARPGLVGGPCLSKDPHILSQSAQNMGLELEITKACRLVNERQPRETVNFILSQISKRQISNSSHIAILGMTFKGTPPTDDLRGSMSLKVLEAFSKNSCGRKIKIFDPIVSTSQLKKDVPGFEACASIAQVLAGSAVAIIANNHPVFSTYGPDDFLRYMHSDGFIYDYWNCFPAFKFTPENVKSYFALGNLQQRFII